MSSELGRFRRGSRKFRHKSILTMAPGISAVISGRIVVDISVSKIYHWRSKTPFCLVQFFANRLTNPSTKVDPPLNAVKILPLIVLGNSPLISLFPGTVEWWCTALRGWLFKGTCPWCILEFRCVWCVCLMRSSFMMFEFLWCVPVFDAF